MARPTDSARIRRTGRPAMDRAPRYSAEQVRGGEILLRSRAERLIFIAGLVGAVILACLLGGTG